MQIEYESETLKQLATDEHCTAGFSESVVNAYRKRIQIIAAAPDERALYAMKSLRFEKLKGNRAGQSSMRLNDRWRLIVRLVKKPTGKIVAVIEIVDYH